jgi:hypothetical protein
MKTLLTSRKFWLLVIALVVLIVSTAVPTFELDEEAGAGFLVIACSYLVGVAVDPGPGGWRGVLQSRKFWAAVLGFLVMTLGAFDVKLPFGLTEDILVEIAVLIGGYIAGVAIEGKLPAPALIKAKVRK